MNGNDFYIVLLFIDDFENETVEFFVRIVNVVDFFCFLSVFDCADDFVFGDIATLHLLSRVISKDDVHALLTISDDINVAFVSVRAQNGAPLNRC